LSNFALLSQILNTPVHNTFTMAAETITISREEYDRLKKLEKVDHDLIGQLVESLEDAKNGRIRRVA
jgi:hypothetical protein